MPSSARCWRRATPETLPLLDAGWSGRPGVRRPLYTQSGSRVTARSVTAERYGRFLIAVFDEWVRRDVGRVFVQTFDVALGSWLGQHNLCIVSPTCGDALALEHTGDLYGCDHYVEPGYRLGNILERPLVTMIASDGQRKFGRDKLDTLPGCCRDCGVLFACYGQCPRNRFIETPDGEPGLNYLCAGYKRFFTHVSEPMQVMADLVRQGRQANEVMAWLREQDKAMFARAGRNDPCPCGSGRKFKRCHGGAATDETRHE